MFSVRWGLGDFRAPVTPICRFHLHLSLAPTCYIRLEKSRTESIEGEVDQCVNPPMFRAWYPGSMLCILMLLPMVEIFQWRSNRQFAWTVLMQWCWHKLKGPYRFLQCERGAGQQRSGTSLHWEGHVIGLLTVREHRNGYLQNNFQPQNDGGPVPHPQGAQSSDKGSGTLPRRETVVAARNRESWDFEPQMNFKQWPLEDFRHQTQKMQECRKWVHECGRWAAHIRGHKPMCASSRPRRDCSSGSFLRMASLPSASRNDMKWPHTWHVLTCQTESCTRQMTWSNFKKHFSFQPVSPKTWRPSPLWSKTTFIFTGSDWFLARKTAKESLLESHAVATNIFYYDI